MDLYKIVFPLLILASAETCKKQSPSVNNGSTVPVDKNWQFSTIPVWADEFNTDGLPDTTKWSYDIGGEGWGNNELQYYTEAENAIIKDGILQIQARKEMRPENNYTSARMVTKNKGDFLYGRIEVRAKLPTGKGLWPAIWMLPTDWEYGGWPASGEIDIMEQVGYAPDKVHISTHTDSLNWLKGSGITAVTEVQTAVTAFHNYRIDWTPYSIRGFIDDTQVFEHINQGKGYAYWPFDKRFHILLNVAVGGNWGGQQGVDDNIFPASMLVDYVRVYNMMEK